MPDVNPQSKHIEFSCACQSVHGSVQVPISTLPLPLTLCHCNVCRHQTGQLAASYVTLPKSSHQTFKVYGETKVYKASEAIIRHFCSTCGCNVYVEEKEFDDISLCSGVIARSSSSSNEGDENENEHEIVRVQNQIFVNDNKDGGMSVWLPDVPGWEGFSEDSKRVDRSLVQPFQRDPHHLPNDQPSSESPINDTKPGKKNNDDTPASETELKCHCHCQRIQFKITRPNSNSYENCRSPFPDLLIQYNYSPSLPPTDDNDNSNNDKRRRIANKADVKWWLIPSSPPPSPPERTTNPSPPAATSSPSSPSPPQVKYLAGLCACTTCRLTSGFDIQSWCFIPKTNILTMDNDDQPFDFTVSDNNNKLAHYTSSKHATRYFCPVCSATVFWHRSDHPSSSSDDDDDGGSRPNLIDVSAGLLSSSSFSAANPTGEGARVEDWLYWWSERVSFCEEAVNKQFVEAVRGGLETWGRGRARGR